MNQRLLQSNVQKKHGFYIGLDEIFDTRLAVLESIDEEQAARLTMGGYFSRERDDFPGIDLYDFRDRYEKRDTGVLRRSTMTSIMYHLYKTMYSYALETLAESKSFELKIVLNLYPYKLTEEEINDMVVCLKIRTKNIAPVEVINRPLKDIHPDWVENNLVCFYCYNWSGWLTHHQHVLLKRRIDSTQLIAPSIVPLSHQEGLNQINQWEKESKDLIGVQNMVDEVFDKDATAFTLMKEMISHAYIGMDFVETREFCTYLPDEVPTPPGKFEY